MSSDPQPPGDSSPLDSPPAPMTEAPAPEPKTEAPAAEVSAAAPSEPDAPAPEASATAPSEPEPEPDAPAPEASATAPSKAEPEAKPEPNAIEPTPTATEPTPPQAAGDTASSDAAEKRKGGLRERIAADRAEQRARRAAQLRGPLPKLLVALLALCLIVWLVRAPIYRVLARSVGGEPGTWALDQLAQMKDADSFDLFVDQMGSSSDTPKYHRLIFLLGGRDRAPEEGLPLPPDVPEQVTAHVAVIQDGLTSESADRRRGALRALWALRRRTWSRDPALLTQASTLLAKNQDLRTRCYAALVLTASPAPASTHPALLEAALGDRSREVRRFAIEALAKTGERSLIPALQPGLRDPASEVRREVQLALASLGAPASFEALAAIYRTDMDVHKTQVLQALSKLTDPRVADLLLEGLSAKLPATRIAALKGLAERKGARERAGIERALRDEIPSVRLAAVDALAKRADGAQSVRALIDAMSRAVGSGWEEVRRLHATLSALTDAAVPRPIQSQLGTWQRCSDAWEQWLERQP